MKADIDRAKAEKQEALEDVFYGQIVFILARWFVIISALFLILWEAETEESIIYPMIPLVFLIAGNFFIHGRYVMRKPANEILLTLANIVDIALITLVIILGGGGSTGIDNPFFVFYFPIILAFSLVFPRTKTLIFASAVVVIYLLVCIFVQPGPSYVSLDEERLAVRSIMLLSTAFLGTMYWRIQRSRRRKEAV